jgi:hypothetical protein
MPRAAFEIAISTFERPKTVFASDRSAIETGIIKYTKANKFKGNRFQQNNGTLVRNLLRAYSNYTAPRH